MRTILSIFGICLAAIAQETAFQRAEPVLGWRVSMEGQTPVEQAVTAPADDAAWRTLFTQAKARGAAIVVVPANARMTSSVEAAANQSGTLVAIDAPPDRAMAAVAGTGKRIGVWADPEAWAKAGLSPLAALATVRDRLLGGRLGGGAASEEVLKEAYRLDLKPLYWTVVPAASAKTTASLEALISYHQSYASRTPGTRRLAAISDEERAKIEAALPAKAPAVPKKPRKLLVFDLNVGRFGHPSIPYANLAMQLMGKKTGAFEATVSSDPQMLEPDKLKTFDAIYLNNTIGDIFATKEARDGFAAFMANGGGLIANHAVTVTVTGWPEFGEILGGRGASHRMTDERVWINTEDPSNPITKTFDGKPFEYADEIFRYQPPYSRDKVRVLLSVDPIRTDMNQGRCFGQCLRDDNDYPVAWIRNYGKGRVFYTTLGHNPHVFWEPRLLSMFLAATQFALGDLTVDATPPTSRISGLDSALADLAKYDRGQEQAPLRRFEREMSLLGPSMQAAAEAERKMLPLLTGNAPLGAKDAVCRQLAAIGSEASVPALASLLAKKETAEMARYALEGIPGSAAISALRDRLANAPREEQLGIMMSLGRRKDEGAVTTLARLVKSSDASVAVAAANALGMIGSPTAQQGIASAASGGSDALLTAAEGAPASAAASIYTGLLTATSGDVRAAALGGLARTAAPGAATALSSALGDSSATVRSAAIAGLARVDATALAGAMSRLDGIGRIQAVNALAARQGKQALPVLLASAKSATVEERCAARRALAEAGGGGQVPMLVEIASRTTGEEQAAARFALTRMPGADVDSAIASAFGGAARGPKIELIHAAGERGQSASAAALLTATADADPGVRREAIRALKAVATPAQASQLTALLVKSAGDDPADYEAALTAAVRRAAKPDIQPVVAALESSKSADVQASLVAVLASSGAPEALPVLRQALANADSSIQRAAVKGLTDWPTADPLDDLKTVAQSGTDPAAKVLALRGAVKLAQLPSERNPATTAKILGELFGMATRPDEKRIVIAALQRVPTAESLEIVRAAKSDPSVAAEAANATQILERALARASR